ncbi:MAG: glycosyltransferase family 4 protein [Candidatus Cryptobacteroides sp.]
MKLIYCHCSLYNPGGMERVLLNKVVWLKAHTDWEIMIVTTDQKRKPTFYPFPKEVRMIDLGINYSDDNDKSALKKIIGYLRKRRLHRKRLTELLMQERADIVVSLFPSESSFIPDINDGSNKVLELHFNKFFRLQYNRKGLLGLIDRWRTRQDERLVRRFDKFVVLTDEDKGYWGELPNIEVIPNAAMVLADKHADGSAKRIIAVGRLDYQKSFDRLIQAWELVQKTNKYHEWRLDIFGQGEWHDMLQRMIDEAGLQDTVHINTPTTHIGDEYAHSSMLVMSSHYEGFPMVMIEAMACGLPVVTFDYKCGPGDIIQDGVNGLLVKDGDIEGLADAMMRLMTDERLRRAMGCEARKVTDTYSEEVVMKKWLNLFNSLMET